MSAIFGPAGNAESFPYKSSADAPRWLAELGLDCYEYQCGKGVNVREETARNIGAAAVAAVDAYPTPLTVVDMGTATTIAVIDDGNAFLGGAVLPGLRISAEALSSRASLLPGIQLERPRRAIGKNTVECMQSGLMFGAAAMVDGLIDRMEAELGRPTTVVATGGVARFVVPLCRHEIALERDLQLKGLDLLYRKNRPRKEAAPDPR